MKILGVETVDYVSRKTGNHVTGIRLHTAQEKRNCTGVSVESFFCKAAAFPDGVLPSVGDEIRLMFNRWGNIEEVSIL